MATRKSTGGKVSKGRYKGMPKSSMALPSQGKYPINSPARARNALARVAQHGTPSQQATVKRAVKRKYPSINVGGSKKRKSK